MKHSEFAIQTQINSYMIQIIINIKDDCDISKALQQVLENIFKKIMGCSLNPWETSDVSPKNGSNLYAFVWHFQHMERNVPDEEILKAWKLQNNEKYRVAKFTPEEFAEYINEDRYNEIENYVRFITTD